MDSSIKKYNPVESVRSGIWATMGLPSRGARLHELVHQDLPFVFYKRLAGTLDMTVNQLRQHLRMSPATLARRTTGGRLSTAESDQICALVGVLNTTLELFEGDLSAARERMKSPARGLNSRLPLDMTSTWVETQAVIDRIGQLEHGVHV